MATATDVGINSLANTELVEQCGRWGFGGQAGWGKRPALLVIDMQKGFDDPAWGPRNNPRAEANVAALIAAWRTAGRPVIHVHHDSQASSGRLRRGGPGNAAKPEAEPRDHEAVYRKAVNSAFIGTQLEADLRAMNVQALAIVGLFSLMTYIVSLKIHDIGIRLALGASRGAILRLMLRRGALLVGWGMLIGLISSLAVTRLMSSQFPGISAYDPLTLAIVLPVVLTAGLAACSLPAHRATQVDPMVTLRNE